MARFAAAPEGGEYDQCLHLCSMEVNNMPGTQPSPQAIGMPWYEPQDWARVKQVMADADKLHATHSAWLQAAEQTERQLRGQGHLVFRVRLQPDEFAAWCRERRLHIDARARTQYASLVAAEQHQRLQGKSGGAAH